MRALPAAAMSVMANHLHMGIRRSIRSGCLVVCNLVRLHRIQRRGAAHHRLAVFQTGPTSGVWYTLGRRVTCGRDLRSGGMTRRSLAEVLGLNGGDSWIRMVGWRSGRAGQRAKQGLGRVGRGRIGRGWFAVPSGRSTPSHRRHNCRCEYRPTNVRKATDFVHHARPFVHRSLSIDAQDERVVAPIIEATKDPWVDTPPEKKLRPPLIGYIGSRCRKFQHIPANPIERMQKPEAASYFAKPNERRFAAVRGYLPFEGEPAPREWARQTKCSEDGEMATK